MILLKKKEERKEFLTATRPARPHIRMNIEIHFSFHAGSIKHDDLMRWWMWRTGGGGGGWVGLSSSLQYLHQIFMKMFPRQTALIVSGSSSASFMTEGGRQVWSQQPPALQRGWNNRHPGARRAPRRPRDSRRQPSARRRGSAELPPLGPTAAATYRQDPHLPSERETDAPLKRLWGAETVSAAAASAFFSLLFFPIWSAGRGAQMWVQWEFFFLFSFKWIQLFFVAVREEKGSVFCPPGRRNRFSFSKRNSRMVFMICH